MITWFHLRKASNFPIFIVLVILVLLLSAFSFSTFFEKYAKISWGNSYKQGDYTYFPGTIKSDFGTMNIIWKVYHNKNFQLVFYESSSGAEISSKETKLYPLYHDNKTVTIYREILPLSNKLEAPKLNKIATVKTNNLHAVVKTSYHSKGSEINQEVKSVLWGQPYQQNGYRYVPGVISTNFGNFNLFLKISPNNAIQLVAFKSVGGAELGNREIRLYLLEAPQKLTTTVFRERLPINNSNEPFMLQRIVVVKTNELNEGIELGFKL